MGMQTLLILKKLCSKLALQDTVNRETPQSIGFSPELQNMILKSDVIVQTRFHRALIALISSNGLRIISNAVQRYRGKQACC
ncbi:MAG: hypothetical protein BGP13_04210 [Sphingobacteriales bacterium 40-81]|nr:MAG: hypothetical protein BGP13_04210 [Sphingobacteriales bacterium 40-81]